MLFKTLTSVSDISFAHPYQMCTCIKMIRVNYVTSFSGWVSVTKYKDHPIRLRAYTPGGRGLYLREPALLPNIKTFRGKRIGGKQEYRVKPPKMS